MLTKKQVNFINEYPHSFLLASLLLQLLLSTIITITNYLQLLLLLLCITHRTTIAMPLLKS